MGLEGLRYGRRCAYASEAVDQRARTNREVTVSLQERLFEGRGNAMLWTIFVILLVLWLLGMVSSYTFGGFIHLLLLIALVMLIFQLISGRRIVT